MAEDKEINKTRIQEYSDYELKSIISYIKYEDLSKASEGSIVGQIFIEAQKRKLI